MENRGEIREGLVHEPPDDGSVPSTTEYVPGPEETETADFDRDMEDWVGGQDVAFD